MTITLPDIQATQRFGQALAHAIGLHGPVVILQTGTLGAGKTTLTRALVEALPGGEQAEVASPSFNLMNRYPTRPQTVHVDLYREAGGVVGEELEDILADPDLLVVVEWAERMPTPKTPCLVLTWEECAPGRRIALSCLGERGCQVMKAAVARWQEHA